MEECVEERGVDEGRGWARTPRTRENGLSGQHEMKEPPKRESERKQEAEAEETLQPNTDSWSSGCRLKAADESHDVVGEAVLAPGMAGDVAAGDDPFAIRSCFRMECMTEKMTASRTSVRTKPLTIPTTGRSASRISDPSDADGDDGDDDDDEEVPSSKRLSFAPLSGSLAESSAELPESVELDDEEEDEEEDGG